MKIVETANVCEIFSEIKLFGGIKHKGLFQGWPRCTKSAWSIQHLFKFIVLAYFGGRASGMQWKERMDRGIGIGNKCPN